MDYREFLARNKELDVIQLESTAGLLGVASHVSPTMKLWLVAMMVNLIVLALLF